MALKDDNINLHVNVNSNPAQESIRQLSETNRDLEKTNKAVRLEMEKLKAQGKENEDEFNLLKNAFDANSASIKKNAKDINELEKSLGLNDMTTTQLRKHAKELQTQLDHTVQAANPQGYADLQKQLEATKGRMGELKGAGQSLSGQLSNIPGPAGSVVKGIQGINTAFKILLANPIMAILAAIVIVFMALYNAIKSSEEATNKLNAIMAPLQAIMDAILNVVQKCVGVILDFISAIINGLMKALESLPFVGKHFKEINDQAKEAIELEKAKQTLEKKERATLVENAEAELKVSKLRTEAKQKDKFAAKERLSMIEEAAKLEQEMADREIANAREKLRIAQAEAARAENTTETERKIAELKAATFQAEKTYYDRTRELSEQKNAARNEMIADEKQQQQQSLAVQLKNIETAIAAEKASLLQSKLDKQISQKEFNQKMEALEIDSLNRKLAVHGLEKEKRDQINQAILEAKIKFQEQEQKQTQELTEKLRQDSLSKNEKELDDIRKKQTERQKLLKDSLELGLITETEYQQRLALQQTQMQAEIDQKQQQQQAAKTTETIAKKDKEHEEEKFKLLQQYADRQITQQEFQQGLIDLEQQFLDEKLQITTLTEEQITKLKEQQLNKQIAAQEKALKKQEDRQKKYTQMFLDFAGNMGSALGDALTNSENSFADALGDILLTALDGLRQMVTMAIAETTINNIKTLGFAGLAKAAGEIALINAAFAAVKGIIKRPSKNNAPTDTPAGGSGRVEVNQRAAGKYDVIGADDHRTYKNIPFIGTPETGIVKQPALIAEQGEELIISTPDMQMLKKHINYPYIVSAINDVRAGTVPQRQAGNYTPLDIQPAPGQQPDAGQTELLQRLYQLLEYIRANGLRAYIGLDEQDAQRKLRDDARNIGTLSK